MEQFRSQLAQHAQAAALAAKQLSSLDEWAEMDDYVQSEGLNVSSKKKGRSEDSRDGTNDFLQSSVVENLSGKFVDALSTAAKPKPRSVESNTQSDRRRSEYVTERTTHASSTQQQQQYPKLMSSVASLYEQNDTSKQATNLNQDVQQIRGQHKPSVVHSKAFNSMKQRGSQSATSQTEQSSPKPTGVCLVNDRHAHILHQLQYDSDSDSSDDDEGTQKQGNLPDELERELDETIKRQTSQEVANNPQAHKDPHRFMTMTADLESERETLIKSLASTSDTTPINTTTANANSLWGSVQKGTAGDETNNALRVGLSWVKNIASSQLQAFSKQIMTKVEDSTRDDQTKQLPMIGPRHTMLIKKESEEEIIMTTSTTFLAEEDRAELERIRNKHSSSQMTALVRTCLEALWENPRFAFILATFVFALLVFWYSRKHSVDDVL
jgi:hypothetical protein|eukprot:scaffold1625_cov192-Alexandrium_tamarense.AAC.21